LNHHLPGMLLKLQELLPFAWACCAPFGSTPSGFTGRLAFIQAPTLNVVAFLKKMNPPRLRVFHLPCPLRLYPGKDKTCPDINPARVRYFTVLRRNRAVSKLAFKQHFFQQEVLKFPLVCWPAFVYKRLICRAKIIVCTII
jgi:hypothetical protein